MFESCGDFPFSPFSMYGGFACRYDYECVDMGADINCDAEYCVKLEFLASCGESSEIPEFSSEKNKVPKEYKSAASISV